jgi:hypothetical protein
MPVAERRVLGRRGLADNETFRIEPSGVRPHLWVGVKGRQRYAQDVTGVS